jgi:hypothetical protein
MMLQAKAQNCFSSTFVLKINDKAVGKFEGRFFSEAMDVALTGQRRFKFEKTSWLGSHFQLKDADTNAVLVETDRSGFFTSSWSLLLSKTKAELRKQSFFGSGYEVCRGDKVLGRVDRNGICERGWHVENYGQLEAVDMILIGLIYQVVLNRQAQQHAAGGGHIAGS